MFSHFFNLRTRFFLNDAWDPWMSEEMKSNLKKFLGKMLKVRAALDENVMDWAGQSVCSTEDDPRLLIFVMGGLHFNKSALSEERSFFLFLSVCGRVKYDVWCHRKSGVYILLFVHSDVLHSLRAPEQSDRYSTGSRPAARFWSSKFFNVDEGFLFGGVVPRT